jgi:hypothetical protein
MRSKLGGIHLHPPSVSAIRHIGLYVWAFNIAITSAYGMISDPYETPTTTSGYGGRKRRAICILWNHTYRRFLRVLASVANRSPKRWVRFGTLSARDNPSTDVSCALVDIV